MSEDTYRVRSLVVGPFQENTFIVSLEGEDKCLIIDPGDDAHRIAAAIDDANVQPLAILNTHAHLDHIGAVAELQERYGIPFYLHPQEKPVLETYQDQCRMFGLKPGIQPKVDEWMVPESNLNLDPFSIKILPTPGHTPGGVSFLLKGHLFVGDTLFHGSVGRTDLPGGDYQTLSNSLLTLLNSVPHTAQVHCGHGPDTTLEKELQTNPFLKTGY